MNSFHWPYPGDSPAARARRVAHAYRATLDQLRPEACAKLDTLMRNMGQHWIVPGIITGRLPNEWVRLHEAAELACVEPETIGKLRRRGRLTGRKINGRDWEYQVRELEEAFSRPRGRPAKRTDTIPTSGGSVPDGAH